MQETRLSHLLEKHLNGSLDQAEKEELYLLSLAEGNQPELAELLSHAVTSSDSSIKMNDDRAHELWGDILQRTVGASEQKTATVRKLNYKHIWWSAASVVIFVSATMLLWRQHAPVQVAKQTVKQPDVQPGREGAVLTLADGRQISLDSFSKGLNVPQQGANVVYKNGQISYDEANRSDDDEPVAYNTISTPNGRQFHLTLIDGSGVWLNAGSSITYPVAFTGNERKVNISGEVYFEVAKDAHKPFRVHSDNGTVVEVLGTNFDINAYSEEASLKTTLLEGKVKVNKQNNSVVLMPGEQAQVSSGIKKVANADIEKIMAWKNGYFNFEGLSLEESMRQLSRWYDIEVVYQGHVPDIKFFGEIGRDVTLNGLIKILAGTGLNFRLDGKKLIVSQ